MPPTLPQLPVSDVLGELVEGGRTHSGLILHAPPGAGKTTLVPLALQNADWHHGRCVVLEPRRIAARAAAERMAALRGEDVGGTVGYTTGEGRRVSRRTRVEVVTEGVLVRRLQRDPSLPGVASVILDEFHERSIEGDLALAFSLEAQAALRPDLRLLVMSATLEYDRVVGLLDDPLVVESTGRAHPVHTTYNSVNLTDGLPRHVVDAITAAMADHGGDVLVFLPGRAEIERTASALRGVAGAQDVAVLPLYGGLSPEAQRRALQHDKDSRRVVLATDIAESSLTVPGVRIVIDAGLVRRPAFDPTSGMSRLVTGRVSAASADQRRGRAAREGPGLCVRLWSSTEALAAHPAPSIAEEDLTPTALEVTAWGTPVQDLALLDQPPSANWSAAMKVLGDIGAVDANLSRTPHVPALTPHGRALVGMPLHPRLGHMVLSAPAAHRRTAADVAALLGERDVLRRRDTDLGLRLSALRGVPPDDAHRGGLVRVRRDASRILRVSERNTVDGVSAESWVDRGDVVGRLVALAYPDRVAMARGDRGSFVLAGGRGGSVNRDDTLAGEEIIAVAALDRGATEARIHLAAALDVESAREMATTRDVVRWGRRRPDATPDVIAERQLAYGAAVLSRSPLADPPMPAVQRALLDGLADEELRPLPWTPAARHLRDRLRHLHRSSPGDGWPAVDDQTLIDGLTEWLGPFLMGARRRSDLAKVNLIDALMSRVPFELHASLNRLAPTRVTVPTGRSVQLDYTGDRPVLAVKLQELFGLTDTPQVAGGRVLLHLLSPAGRPLQVTDDLGGFWSGSYAQVRSEMRGRYPKHPWPEDPAIATPTRHTKRRAGRG